MENSPDETGSLRTEEVRRVLDGLHDAARWDLLRFVGLAPRLAIGFLKRKDRSEILTPSVMRNAFIPVSRESGMLLYLTARAIRATRIVEFGTSFGISTLYLAAAVRDNGGGVVIGTEIEASKHERAVANLREAGLGDLVEVRLGDALQTLKDVPDPIDLIFLDGWKGLYLPVLELLKPKLRAGGIVLADNILDFKKALRPYVEYMQSGQNGFESTTLSVAGGVEYSYCRG